ncbi:ATP-binding cassette domain-containing protein [Ancylobacter sonchi]|uniref:iron ABC transporter ATP-binding protein n=1 Tax=Ancylobacter TaxID=99 RepID=UPI001BD53165|nr:MULTISPECIES: ATP-binding cassette domain-containing protein [Ancylobacter]MBS7532392.1 ATP-binding cassette domain-containing protein [Ancylobacter sonchi]MCB4769632.1 ATP-binding cassette domain-containing protein [Ancylobacter sp. Lp-2]
MIEIEGLSMDRDGVRVLDDVSLQIPDRSLTMLIGPNGAGKSTLLGLIARLLRPSAGHVRVDGLDVFRAASDAVARKLAILRQENHILPQLTVEELVGFGRYPHSRGRLAAEDRRQIADALHRANIAALAGRRLFELSGGQRQRAFLAMVLAQDTPYLLLDEPLNNLDPRQAISMMQVLRRAVTDLGKSIVMVVHDVNCASFYGDRIVAMNAGRLVAMGSPKDIVVPSTLRMIYGVDMSVHEVGGARIVQPFS